MQRVRWAAWKQVKQALILSNGCAISSKSQSCASQSLWERSIVTIRPYSASSEGWREATTTEQDEEKRFDLREENRKDVLRTLVVDCWLMEEMSLRRECSDSF